MTLWDLRTKLDEQIAARQLDKFATYGKVALITGQLIPKINAATPSPPEQVEKLRSAIAQVIGVHV